MRRNPRSPQSPLLDGKGLRFIAVDGVFKGAVGLSLLVVMPEWGFELGTTATSVFLYESAAKLLSVYPARRIGAAPEGNPWLHVSVGAGLLLGVACVLIVPLRNALGLSVISAEASLLVGGAVIITWLAGELVAWSLRSLPAQEARLRAT
jgi:hypothetical protein